METETGWASHSRKQRQAAKTPGRGDKGKGCHGYSFQACRAATVCFFFLFLLFPLLALHWRISPEMFLHFAQSKRSSRLHFSSNFLVDVLWTSAYLLYVTKNDECLIEAESMYRCSYRPSAAALLLPTDENLIIFCLSKLNWTSFLSSGAGEAREWW